MLTERVKCLIDFQLSCRRKVGRILCQKKDPRVRLISMQKPQMSKIIKVGLCGKVPALCFGPAENPQVSKYKLVMKSFPVSFRKQPWSDIDKENLAKGLKQQCQEKLLLDSLNSESDVETSVSPDLMSAMISNNLQVTPENIRSFLPDVKWDRLASMYLPGRSGAECESRWLNCEDPLINHSPWTVSEDKKLLYIVQERGIYNWIEIATMLGTQRTPFQCLARYQRSLNPHILNKDWTEDEDVMLRAAVQTFGESNWQLVASNLEGRTGTQCSNRWRKTLNPDRSRVGRWSVDEDKRLKVAVMLFGAKNWNKIAQFAPGRTQVQCRERWLNCLDPSLKLEPWTEDEDEKLKTAIQEYGHSWSRVASCVPPRTDNQCMRRWKYLFPEEVLLLSKARKMKKAVLVSNFVDRESEWPSIGPSDFSSHEIVSISECENSRQGKKRSSENKIKKSRRKSRQSSEDDFTEGSSSMELNLVPTEPGTSTDIVGNGRTKRKKILSREGRQLMTQRTVARCSKKLTVESGMSMWECSIEDSEAGGCLDEDAPLVTWLDSLSSKVGCKRPINGLRPRAKRRRCFEEPTKNNVTDCGNNNKRYLALEQNGESNQSGEVLQELTMVDVSDGTVPKSDGLPNIRDVPPSGSSGSDELNYDW